MGHRCLISNKLKYTMTLISSLEAVDHLQRTAVYLALIPFAYLSFKLIQRIHASLLGPLRHVPGPWLSRYTKLWEVAVVWRGDFEKQNIDLHKRHGEMIQLHQLYATNNTWQKVKSSA